MRDVLPALIAALDAGPVALARVISTTGAVPRAVGAAMALTDTGEIIGSLSGGCVESAVIETASQVLAEPFATIEHFGFADPDGIEIGLTCGGEMEVFVEKLSAADLPALNRLAQAVAEGTPAAWATTLTQTPARYLAVGEPAVGNSAVGEPAIGAPRQPFYRLDGDIADLLSTGRSGIIGIDDCENDDHADSPRARPRTFVQTLAPRSRLILVGANDFVRALAELGATLGYQVSVVDARPVFATPARFPAADEVIVEWPDRYLEREIATGNTSATTCVCVMTHDAKFDVPTLRIALAAKEIGFVGALGSRRTVAERKTRLQAAGVGPTEMARLRSPLGLDLGGHTPAEVAVSIAAQLIADRHDASGESLTLRSGPIHR